MTERITREHVLEKLADQGGLNVPVVLRESFNSLPESHFQQFVNELIDIYMEAFGTPSLKASIYETLIRAVAEMVATLEQGLSDEQEKVRQGLEEGKSFQELTGYAADEGVETDMLPQYHRDNLEVVDAIFPLLKGLRIDTTTTWDVAQVREKVETYKSTRKRQ